MCTSESFDTTSLQPRNDLWDVLKGIGIMAVVIGHSGCPVPLQRFISAFHMPLFFMISGILLNDLYFKNKIIFVKRKIVTLYIPFIKWSMIFILLHNLFFYFGILNSSYGYAGQPSRWYSFYDIIYCSVVALVSMNTFELLLGAFWFLKALFVGSIIFVFFGTKRTNAWIPIITWALCIINIFAINHFYLLNFFETRFIGHKELFALFFISLGFAMRNYIHYLHGRALCITSFILLLVTSQIGNLSMAPMIKNVLLLPISAVCGFIFCFNISHLVIKKNNWLMNLIRNTGLYSFYILMLHFTCFKIVSFFKIWLYDLDTAKVAELVCITSISGLYIL